MIWEVREPENESQNRMRNLIDNMVENISKGERCCKICADTINDGELIDLKTNKGVMTFCSFCYKIQTSNLNF